MSRVLRSYKVFNKPYIINAMEEFEDCSSETENNEVLNKVDVQEMAMKKAEEIIKSANKKYEEIIKKAHEEAEIIRQNAIKEIETAKLVARQEGFDLGQKIGYEEAMKKIQSDIEEAQNLKKLIIEEKERIFKAVESDIINLVISSVEKILKTTVEFNKEYLINIINDGIRKSTYNQYLKIRVSEDDFGYIIENKVKILSSVEGLKDVEIEKDLSLDKGDIIIETPAGWIDCGLKTQIERLKEIFKGVMKDE